MADVVAAFGAYALPGSLERLRRAGLGLGRSGVARKAVSLIRRVVMAGRPGPFDVEPFPGQRARLYPRDNLSEKRVFSGAQFWDWDERAALSEAAAKTDHFVFVDAGANAGLYTLAVRAAARGFRGLAVEPDPENRARLMFNLAASDATEVTVAPVALAAVRGKARIAAGHANRGELMLGPEGTEVETRPLLDVVREAGLDRIDALKIDIEGHEEPVLRGFLADAPDHLRPHMIIIEAQRGARTPALVLLEANGYQTVGRTRMNAILTRPTAKGAGRIEVAPGNG